MIGWTKACTLYEVYLFSNDGLYLIRQKQNRPSLYVRKKVCVNKKMAENYFHSVININGGNIRYDHPILGWCKAHNWQLMDKHFLEQIQLQDMLSLNGLGYESPKEQLALGVEIPFRRKETFVEKLIGYVSEAAIKIFKVKDISKEMFMAMPPEERIRSIEIELKAIRYNLSIDEQSDRFGMLLELMEEAVQQAK